MKMKSGWSAAKGLWLCLLWAVVQTAWAAGEAAVVVSMVGTVSAQKPDGKVRVLTRDSVLMSDEIVMTEKGSTVRLRFTDGSMTSLRPASRLVIETYHFDEGAPDKDSIVLNLIKGGMRALSGLISKRGNQDAYRVKSFDGTIGIRGTDYALLLCEKAEGEQGGNCTGLEVPEGLLSNGAPAEGLYLTVFEGAILLANNASETIFPVGKSAYVRNANTAPVDLPRDPGLVREFPAFGNLPGVMNPFGGAQEACLVR